MLRQDVLDLLPYCETDRQREVLNAIAHFATKGAAQELGLNIRNVERTLQRVKTKAVMAGKHPASGLVHPLPSPLTLDRVTQTVLPDGSFGPVWVKSKVSADRQRLLMQEAVDVFKQDMPRAKPVKQARSSAGMGQLLNLFPITDYHIGMYAWPEETNDDPWDTDIAADLLYRFFERAITLAPAAETAVLANIGDFMHFSGLEAITPQSGHILDADTRFQRVVRLTIQVIRRVISLLLTQYPQVHVIMAEGNHDRDASPWLRELFHAFYELEPRVTIDITPDPYYCVEHGLTSLFFHHGHLSKMEKVDRAFAGKFRDVFGRTKYSYAHMGHFHHEKVLESELMVVKQHRTLAPSDAYASRGGWLNGREAEVITYHKAFGRVGTVSITPEMLKEVA